MTRLVCDICRLEVKRLLPANKTVLHVPGIEEFCTACDVLLNKRLVKLRAELDAELREKMAAYAQGLVAPIRRS